MEGQLAVLPADKQLELRVFTDHTLVEAFFMDGRVALTAPLPGAAVKAGFRLFSSGKKAMDVGVRAWELEEIWVSPEQVIASL